jgi:hypothetical protein
MMNMTEINQEDYFKQSYFPRMFVNPQFVGFICENGCTGPSGKSFGWPAKIDHALRFPVYCAVSSLLPAVSKPQNKNGGHYALPARK